MQFRVQGNRVQVLAYRGYDREKRRAQVKLMGSFNRWTFDMTDGLMDSLTVDERSELQSHIEKIRLEVSEMANRHNIRTVAKTVREAADCLTSDKSDSLITAEVASSILEAMDSLTAALRKRGFRRVAKSTATVTGKDPGGSHVRR